MRKAQFPQLRRAVAAGCAILLAWTSLDAQVFSAGERVADLLQSNPYCEVTATVSDSAVEIISVRSLPTAPEGFLALVIPARCLLDGEELAVGLAAGPKEDGTIRLAEGEATWIVSVDSGVRLPSDCSRLLAGSTRLVTLDLHAANTAAVTSLAEMLDGCSALEDANMAIATDSLTDASGLFRGCSTLNNVDLSAWNPAQLEDMSEMFAGCEELKAVVFPAAPTSSLRRTAGMFRGCTAIEELDLRSLDTRQATDLQQMFAGCRTLQHLILGPHFCVSPSARHQGMLQGCTSIPWSKIEYVGDEPPTLPSDWPKATPLPGE